MTVTFHVYINAKTLKGEKSFKNSMFIPSTINDSKSVPSVESGPIHHL